jgi:hypothetical protein
VSEAESADDFLLTLREIAASVVVLEWCAELRFELAQMPLCIANVLVQARRSCVGAQDGVFERAGSCLERCPLTLAVYVPAHFSRTQARRRQFIVSEEQIESGEFLNALF